MSRVFGLCDLATRRNLPLFALGGLLLWSGVSRSSELVSEPSEMYRPAEECTQTVPDVAITLHMAVACTLRNNPQARGAWASVHQSMAQLDAAKGALWPTLNGSIPYTFRKQKLTVTGSEIDHLLYDSNMHSVVESPSLTLQWKLFDFGGIQSGLRSARAQLNVAGAQQRATLQQLFLNAAKAYFAAIDARATLEAAARAASYAAESESVATSLYAAGTVAIADKLQARVATSQARLKQISADGALRAAEVSLLVGMGRPVDVEPAIDEPRAVESGDEVIGEAAELIDQAREHSPSVLLAMSKLQSAIADLHVAEVDGRPSISLTGELAPRYTRYPHAAEQLFGYNDVPLDNHSSLWDVGLTVSIPLFDGFVRRSKRAAGRAAVVAAEANLADSRRQVTSDTSNFFNNLRTQALALTEARALRSFAQELYSVAIKRYRSGVGLFTDVLNAQTKVVEADQTLIETESSLRTARLNLLAAIGLLTLEATD